jgi:flagellar biosynthesis protein FlhF
MMVKTYKAMDMQEAIRMIKRDLGSQAVILSTRKVVDGKRAFGLLGRPMVEVTAAVDGASGGAQPGTSSSGEKADGNEGPTARSLDMLRGEMHDLRRELTLLAQAQRVPADEVRQELGQGLEELRWWVSHLARGTNPAGAGGGALSPQAAESQFRLVQQGVRESHALQILSLAEREVQREGKGELGPERIFRTLERLIRIVDPMESPEPGPRVLALVGPTGVGKTTTVAKIAAQCALAEGRKVALITNDTYRIAAVEQLRTYARIMNLPLEVVLEPHELPGILDAHGDKDVILMDTAGRSPFDAVQMGELRALMEADRRIRSLLLLGASTDERGLERVVQRFAPLKPMGVIGTKLDEASRFGPLFSVCLQSRLPFAFFTNGQRVPEDIRKAARQDAANWTLWGLPCFYREGLAATGQGS